MGFKKSSWNQTFYILKFWEQWNSSLNGKTSLNRTCLNRKFTVSSNLYSKYFDFIMLILNWTYSFAPVYSDAPEMKAIVTNDRSIIFNQLGAKNFLKPKSWHLSNIIFSRVVPKVHSSKNWKRNNTLFVFGWIKLIWNTPNILQGGHRCPYKMGKCDTIEWHRFFSIYCLRW